MSAVIVAWGSHEDQYSPLSSSPYTLRTSVITWTLAFSRSSRMTPPLLVECHGGTDWNTGGVINDWCEQNHVSTMPARQKSWWLTSQTANIHWCTHTDAVYKKGLSHPHLLRRPGSFVVNRTLLRTYDEPVVVSAVFYAVVCCCVVCWSPLGRTSIMEHLPPQHVQH